MNPSGKGRPRPRGRVLVDPTNAYSRLGVSPAASTEEIKSLITKRQNETKRRRGRRGDKRFGTEEEELLVLQRIDEEIGSPAARAAYDLANPQNELLTVQRADRDAILERRNRGALVSAWLVEELGRDAGLPTPDSLHLWCPRGLAPELEVALAPFVGEQAMAPLLAEGGAVAPEDTRPLDEADVASLWSKED